MNFDEILQSILPSQEDNAAIQAAIKEVAQAICTAAKINSVDIVVTPGGSTAKGTYLKGNFDIDLFVRFKSVHASLSNELELLLSNFTTQKNIVVERVHGSRDYFTFSYENFFFEIVPVKYVEGTDGVENVTDMSPLHVLWMNKHLTPSLQNDIRLAKQFCKSASVYGAESYINGVSGHVLDILLVHYGSFQKWLEAVSTWSGVTVIDTQQIHEDVFTALNQSKLVSPLIVVDPVDPQRNAAAALSQEKYDLLITKAKDFLANPSKNFFMLPVFNKKEIQEAKNENEFVIIISVQPLEGKADVVATKILKAFEFLKRHIQLYDFQLRNADWFYQEKESYLYFYVDKKDLEKTVVRCGPPTTLTGDVEKFKEVHGETFEQDGRVCAHVQREFTSFKECMNHLLAIEYITSRVSSVSSEWF